MEIRIITILVVSVLFLSRGNHILIERRLDWIRKVIISFGSVIIVIVVGGATIIQNLQREMFVRLQHLFNHLQR